MHQYIDGKWGTASSTLDKARTDVELSQQLKTLGFQEPQELVYRGGQALLYSRGARPNTPVYPFPFDFCCVLYVGKGLCPVGLKQLQDVHYFLQEIDAHPKEAASPIDLSWLKTSLHQLNTTMAGLSTLLHQVNLSQALVPIWNGPPVEARPVSGRETGPQTHASQPLFEEDPLFEEYELPTSLQQGPDIRQKQTVKWPQP